MAIRAEIITVGNELVTGLRSDTNGPYLAERLLTQGIITQRITSVGDEVTAIANTVKESRQRSEVVLVTGGLGSTSDDVTAEAAAQVLKRTMTIYPKALEYSTEPACSWDKEPADAQKKLAYFPAGVELIPNPQGNAPGFLVAEPPLLLFFLPGVPPELRAMTEQSVLPRLAEAFTSETYYQSRTVKIFGITETTADARLKDIPKEHHDVDIAFLPRFPEIEIRIMVRDSCAHAALEKLRCWETEIRKRLEPYVIGIDAETMEEVVGRLLRESKAEIAVAESCTGGLIGHRLTNIAGSSDYVDRIVVSYSNKAKVEMLNVPEAVISAHGAVSEPTARFMAEGLRALAGTTLGLATTGIAGPGGGTSEKPVGTVFISLADGTKTWVKEYRFSGTRLQIKQMTSQVALDWVRRYLLKKSPLSD
ncbi:MAG: competence/damage-inducible protein A [Deltaproteobacteria bacterium]|nr:competence/damage-inducible protein A [Deltaproteobacteria bacterium]